MYLPHRENAVVKQSKVVEYLLSKTHSIGKNKAKFFNSIGYNEDNHTELSAELLKFKDLEISKTEQNEFGSKYSIEGTLAAPNRKSYTIKTVWMLEHAQTQPYLITAFPIQK